MDTEVKDKPAKAKRKSKKISRDYFYGTGRRKTAIARVWLKPGNNGRIVNGKTAEDYFCKRIILLKTLEIPFEAIQAPAMDLEADVYGGGVPAQADAIRMGVARALIDYNPDFRKVLRSRDLLKRDPREKERKKAGRKRARKSFQYTKR